MAVTKPIFLLVNSVAYPTNKKPLKLMFSNEQLTEYIERARRHVQLGGATIERHKKLLESHRIEGRDTKPAEDLLAAFERSQKVFEHDLARLERMKRRALAIKGAVAKTINGDPRYRPLQLVGQRSGAAYSATSNAAFPRGRPSHQQL
jgi:hypothetical protein